MMAIHTRPDDFFLSDIGVGIDSGIIYKYEYSYRPGFDTIIMVILYGLC